LSNPLCPDYTVLIRPSNGHGQCFNGKREVAFDAEITSGGKPQSYFWAFGDSHTAGPFPFPPQGNHFNPEVHLYNAPGSPSHITQYPAKLTLLDFDGQCRKEFTKVVNVPGCGAEEESTGCIALRVALVIAAIMAALALYMCLCVTFVPPNPVLHEAICWTALGLGIAAAALLLIWNRFCPNKPCGAWLLIGWQIALGTGIGATYFATCPGCGYLWFVGAGLILAAGTGFVVWVRRCRVSRCRALGELGWVLGVIVVPVLAWVAKFKFLAPCLDDWVAASVGTVASIVLYWWQFVPLKGTSLRGLWGEFFRPGTETDFVRTFHLRRVWLPALSGS
jgi:hypothetical protein